MIKVLDWRLRVPYKSYKNTGIFNPSHNKMVSEKFGFGQAPSAAELSLDKMLQEMDNVDVTKAIVHGRIDDGLDQHVDNNDIIELMKLYPDRFMGFCGVDLAEPEQAVKSIEELVVNGPFHGVVLEPGWATNPYYADDKVLMPLYEYMNEHEIIAALQLGYSGGPDLSYNDPVIVDRLSVAFPKMKIVVSHGQYPYATAAVQMAYRRKNIWMCPDMYATHTPGAREYIEGANYIAYDRMIFGTAYPLLPIEDVVNFAKKEAGLNARAIEYYLYKNAADLLGIE